MKITKTLKGIAGAAFFSFCLFSLQTQSFADTNENSNQQHSVFAQLSSSETQLPQQTEKEVTFENVHAISGLRLQDNAEIKIESDGLYLIEVTGQAGSGGLGFSGAVKFVLYKNNEPIENTKRSQWVQLYPSKTLSYPFTTHVALRLRDGDQITLRTSADAINLGLVANASNGTSVALTIVKIDK